MSFHRSNNISKSESNIPTGRVGLHTTLYLAKIKDNADATKMGRLQVWISEFGSLEKDNTGWITVDYCSPFAGATPVSQLGKDDEDFFQTQTSYGMWMVPPDVDNYVLVMFVNGNPSAGFWLGCVFQQNMNNSVPDKPFEERYRDKNKKYKSLPMPTAEYNKNAYDASNINPTRPVFATRAKGISAQGLIKDKVRGFTTSSARRESPSNVYGISTPGPMNDNKKGRKGGHTFVMDDAVGSEHISLKTRSGTQIRLDETNGLIYIINRDGTTWFQFDADGNGDLFLANDFSIRALNNINFRADNNINIEAGGNVNILANKTSSKKGGEIPSAGGGSGGKVNICGMDAVEIKSIGVLTMASNDRYETCQKFNLKSSGDLNLDGNKINLKSASDLNLDGLTVNIIGATAVNMKSAAIGMRAIVSIDGTLNINTGAAGIALPASPAAVKEPSALKTVQKTNILQTFKDEYERNTQSGVSTITSRFPTFEPCPEHTIK